MVLFAVMGASSLFVTVKLIQARQAITDDMTPELGEALVRSAEDKAMIKPSLAIIHLFAFLTSKP